MIDREKVLTILHRRFPGSTLEERAAAANAIVGLGDEWVDVTARESEMGFNVSAQCAEMCFLAEQRQLGREFRILLRRPPD